MMDQAEKLRQIIDDLKFRNAVTLDNPSGVREKTAKVITVTSGKGGVARPISQ